MSCSDTDDDEPEPLKRQDTGLTLTMPVDSVGVAGADDAPGPLTEILLATEEGNEWKTEIDGTHTVEYVKALAREHFPELKSAELVRDHHHCFLRLPCAWRL